MSRSRQNSEHPGPRLPDQLARDLREVFGKSVDIPARVDRELATLARRGPRRRPWAMVRRVSALAAALVAALLVGRWVALDLTSPSAPGTGLQVAREDFDGSGRVDILDAYRLALLLGRGETVAPQWDIDGNGLVDGLDVDAIAMRAVSLSNRGDGR